MKGMSRSCSLFISTWRASLLYICLILGDGDKFGLFNSNHAFVGAANWAQVVGKQRQNIVKPAKAGFSPRWGHAAIHTDTTTGVDVIESMIVMGGDTVESLTQNEEIIVGVQHDGTRGFRNDIYAATSYSWTRYQDKVEKTEYNVPVPKIEGNMEWEVITEGEVPPSDKTYDEWLQCDYDAWEETNRPTDYANRMTTLANNGNDYDCTDVFTVPGSYLEDTMWSPRRAHAAINDGSNVIYVMGGRAREHKRLANERAVGGITTRPIENDKFHSAWREASVLKNDVWKSTDEGVSWSLVNPGCKVPQRDLIIAGKPYVRTRIENKVNEHVIEDLPRYGAKEDKCDSDSDCWGDATCETLGRDSTCVCNMWSPREHHAAVAHSWNDDDTTVFYVMGGFASKRQRNCGNYACGDIDAASYRQYMNDIWRSDDDGVTWTVVTLNATWAPRGGHTAISFLGSIYLFNGQGGTMGQHPKESNTYFGDLWQLSSEDGEWENDFKEFTLSGNGTKAPWNPRFGHATAVESPNAANSEISRLYMSGGRDDDDFLSDSWSWRGPGYDWIKDYSGDTQQKYYIDEHSDIHELKNVVPNNNKWGNRDITRENFTTVDDLKLLYSQGIYTIGDLAHADRRTILRLRGYDLPQVPEENRLQWSEEKGGRDGVCYMFLLAKSVVEKCSEINHKISEVDGEDKLPWNQRPKFKGGVPPEDLGVVSEWHGIDWSNLGDGSYESESLEDMIENWDGCSSIPKTPDTWPEVDVSTIGSVPQVSNWKYNRNQQIGEIICKSNPFPRAFHASVYFSQQIWLIGGKRDVDDHNNDLWYRDNVMPVSTLNTKPKHESSDRIFEFKSNKEGAIFRYRVYYGDKLKEVRPWTLAYDRENIGWLKDYNDVGEKSNKHTEKGPEQQLNEGPGEGNYIFYLRGVDPAGNEDLLYTEGRNMHTWRYVPDPPAVLITLIFFFLFFCACYVGYEYHKYARAMALERYAIKRIRRKFKGMMADGGDRDAKTLHKKAGKHKKKHKHKHKKGKHKKHHKKGKDGHRAKGGGGKKSKKKKKKGTGDRKRKKKKVEEDVKKKKDKKKVSKGDAKKQRTKGEERKLKKEKPEKEKEKKKKSKHRTKDPDKKKKDKKKHSSSNPEKKKKQ